MSYISEYLDRLRLASSMMASNSTFPIAEPIIGPGCSSGEIEELQEISRNALPIDYLEFLSLCRRVVAQDVYNGYFIYSPISVGHFDSSIPRFLHVELNQEIQEVWVVCIAGDGGGNQFLMGTSNATNGYIWKWSHEFPPRFDGMASEGLKLVAKSFTQFLALVVDDWEHFAAHDNQWQYISG